MTKPTIRVAIDVGSKSHRVGVGLSEGQVLEGFSIAHNQKGFEYFFGRVELHRQRLERPVEVAMEGYNGWARPLDQQIQQRGYKLLNVNNLKLARFKEIFPAPAKTDQIDTDKMLELFQLGDTLKRAKNVIQEVKPVPAENQQLKRLTRRRRQLVDEKVSLGNRLLADLQAICPELSALTGSVDNRWFLNFLTARKDLRQLSRLRRHSVLQIKRIGSFYADIIQSWQKEAHFSAEVEWVGEMIHHDARRMLELLEQIAQLNNAIEDLTQRSAMAQRIRSIPGFGIISSAELAGEIGTLERFAGEASLAMYLGMATLDNSSSQTEGARRTRHVNQRTRQAMMRLWPGTCARFPSHRPTTPRREPKAKDTTKLSDPWPVIWFECYGKCSPRTATTRSAHEKTLDNSTGMFKYSIWLLERPFKLAMAT